MSTSPSSATPPAGGPDAETTDPTGSSEDSQKWFAKAAQSAPQAAAQAAALARFRFSSQPESLTELAVAVGVLYGGFIGIPFAGALWAIWKIAHGGY